MEKECLIFTVRSLSYFPCGHTIIGIGDLVAPLEISKISSWKRLFDVNVFGLVETTQVCCGSHSYRFGQADACAVSSHVCGVSNACAVLCQANDCFMSRKFMYFSIYPRKYHLIASFQAGFLPFFLIVHCEPQRADFFIVCTFDPQVKYFC